jgi:hypothetical protein
MEQALLLADIASKILKYLRSLRLGNALSKPLIRPR